MADGDVTPEPYNEDRSDYTNLPVPADAAPGEALVPGVRKFKPTGSRAAHLITARYERLAVLELFLGWDCSCGIGGPDEASLTLHAHEHGASVRHWLGEYVNGLYREAERGRWWQRGGGGISVG